MRVIIIDNYDSFTYNLAQLVASSYGLWPRVVRNDELDWAAFARLEFDAIIISPGPGRPQRKQDLGLSATVIERADVPILGVCLGHQAIAHSFGGAVGLAKEPVHGQQCAVDHDGTDLFAGVPSPFLAVRYHSLAVLTLPSALEGTAWAGDGTLMALRHRSRPIWGVQFHPESIATEHGSQMMLNFRRLCRNQKDTAATASTDR